MINEKYAKKYCKDDISKIENYDKAVADNTQIWPCHHRDEVKVLPSGIEVRRSREELKENGRYYNCPANELIFLTKEEHNRLHHKGNKYGLGKHFSEEHKRNLSESHKGNKSMSGKHHSEESKRKISEALKGKSKSYSDFGNKFKAHFGKTRIDDLKLYNRELGWYHRHNKKCRWE
jgi:hypothetical protein